MRHPKTAVALTALAATLLSVPALAAGQGKAAGTPQRGATPPPGLLANLERDLAGLARARLATQGSNSRLQDLPDSP